MLFPVLKTDRIVLRRFTAADLDDVYRGLSDPAVVQYYGVSYDSREAAREQMEWFASHEAEGTGIWWAVCSAGDGTFYGAGGLNDIVDCHRKAEIGFWLLPQFQRQGIMSEAVPLICGYGLETLGLHRIEGYVDSRNTACKNAITKLGFDLEGTMRDCEIKDGEFISLDIYAKLSK